MRLYYTHIGSPFVDVEWDKEAVTKYKTRLANIYNVINQIKDIHDKKDKNLDNWLISMQQRIIQKTVQAFDNFDLRIAANEIFFENLKNLQWYLKRGGSNKKTLDSFVKTWIQLMTPITPHLAEELWHESEKTFVSNEEYPVFDKEKIHEKEEIGEYLVAKVVDDISEILKVTKIKPKKIVIYTSPKWKQEIQRKAIKLAEKQKFSMGLLMKQIMEDSEMKKIAKEVTQFTGKLSKEIMKLNENDKRRYMIDIDEKEYLESAKNYFENIFKCEIEIFKADDEKRYDPNNKNRFAVLRFH